MTDNCPRCLTAATAQGAADGTSAYVCRSCGHTWTTSRTYGPHDVHEPYATYDDPDAWEADNPPTPYDPRADDHHDQADDEQQLVARILAAEPHHTVTLHRLDTPQ
ncbi:hypothetical protein OG292_22425 [Streptomyces sp. NBC_01511]|uniref:hypothetical protein n=1 Tax=Streptomyces sp. NBC_01511 TaxID=2903889 RepID=UPI003868D6A3